MFPKKEDSQANTVAAITQKDDQVSLSQELVSFVGVTCSKENLTLLPIVRMEIVGKDGNIMEVYGLLDQGSEVTRIDQRAADELGLEGEISKTQFHTFHNRDPVINVKEVSVNVSSLDKASSFKLENCYAVPKLNLAKRDFNWRDLQQRWPHLSDIELQNTTVKKWGNRNVERSCTER